MNSELEHKLSVKLHELMKKKIKSAKIIWKYYKSYKFRKNMFKNLKLLVYRKGLWKKFAYKFALNS